MALRFLLVCLVAFSGTPVFSQQLQWKEISPQTDASFRALSVVDDSVAWVGGTKGWIGMTKDGGTHWTFSQVEGFEDFDFRSLYAFSSQSAIIANAGSPANVLATQNGGKDWKLVYTIQDTSAFIDGIDFWNEKEGLIYGDPMQGKMLLLRTQDGGVTWKSLSDNQRPSLKSGEASFAASGTNIRCMDRASVVICTGGKVSRLWMSDNKGSTWKSVTPPILHGQPSTGIFSFSGFHNNRGVIVGGDYMKDTLSVDHAFYTIDKGKTWHLPSTPTRGYRECVEFLTETTLVAAGPTGIDVSMDGGKNWFPESDEQYFHVVRKARSGTLVIIAGGKGKISILKF